jgi:hypothetical protein
VVRRENYACREWFNERTEEKKRELEKIEQDSKMNDKI